jgi:nucleotide-binding universal stress UspA family protein
MYRSILVPLDGSPFGEHALPLALTLARKAGARLQLAHVQVLPAPMFVECRANVENTRDPRAVEKAKEYLENVAKRLAGAANVAVSPVVLEGGIVAALTTHVTNTAVDLVVMTTHGRGPFSRFWLGSVADEFIRRAPVPVLLVRPQETPADLAREVTLRKLLVPLDGSAVGERILEPAVALGSLMKAEVTLLRVVPPPMFTVYEPMGYGAHLPEEPSLEEQRRHAQAYVDQVAARLRAQSRVVSTRVLVGREPAEAILEEAQTQGSHFIALATHGRKGLTRLLLGSVADKVIRAATIPILVCRRQEE